MHHRNFAKLVGTSSDLRDAVGIAEMVKQVVEWMQQERRCISRLHCINDKQGAVADFQKFVGKRLPHSPADSCSKQLDD